ncbi:hypothetical protein G6L37_04355 [Agrobacterium rubi]|nr:hypothetical protein [Agrobacterium rubi]NTF24584.1 hypothetical protein [Agrobacterium rubi]
MANYSSNKVYVFGEAQSIRALLADRIGKAGEVEVWEDAVLNSDIATGSDECATCTELLFQATSRELDTLIDDLSGRYSDLVITHASFEPASRTASARVWLGGSLVGEYEMTDEEMDTCLEEAEIFEVLLSSVASIEDDAQCSLKSSKAMAAS